MVKRLKKDSSSCSPLKANGKLINDTYGKAEALNKQFQSVFNPTTHSNLPDMGPSSFPSMKKFKFTVPGILKLLQDMQIHKAPGPDKIVPRLLHDFAHILAEPLVEILINRLKHLTYLMTGRQQMLFLSLIKENVTNHQIIDQFP